MKIDKYTVELTPLLSQLNIIIMKILGIDSKTQQVYCDTDNVEILRQTARNALSRLAVNLEITKNSVDKLAAALANIANTKKSAPVGVKRWVMNPSGTLSTVSLEELAAKEGMSPDEYIAYEEKLIADAEDMTLDT